MNGRVQRLIVLASIVAAPPAFAQRISNEAGARAVCAAATDRFKPGPLHTAIDADRDAFKSESFCADYIYAWIGDEKNYDKARRCCLVKGDCNRELGMLFANGWGVARDYDAATHFLCKAAPEMAPAEQWGMLDHVQRMRAGAEPDDLLFCNYVTSGRGQTFCASLESNRVAGETEAILAPIRDKLATESRAAMVRLEKAAEAVSDAQSGYVTYGNRLGTAYPAMIIEAQTEAFSRFVKVIETVSQRRAPAAGRDAFTRADAALNAAYRRAMQTAEPCVGCSDDDVGERDALRRAQRAWIAYRDAFTAFYRLRWKGAAAADALDREIATLLTLARAGELRPKP